MWVLSPTATWCLLIGRKGGRGGNGGDVAEEWRGLGAADAAVPPGVRKRGHDGYSWSPGKEVLRERGGGSLVGTLRSLFVTVSLKWIQGGQDFFQGGKERRGPIVKGGSLWMPDKHNRPLSYVLSVSAPAWLNWVSVSVVGTFHRGTLSKLWVDCQPFVSVPFICMPLCGKNSLVCPKFLMRNVSVFSLKIICFIQSAVQK